MLNNQAQVVTFSMQQQGVQLRAVPAANPNCAGVRLAGAGRAADENCVCRGGDRSGRRR